MLHAYLGPNDFKNGLSHYLKRFSYENATTNDLWEALEEISNKPVKDFMGQWTSQVGFPLLDASVKGSEFLFSQQRYMISPVSARSSRTKRFGQSQLTLPELTISTYWIRNLAPGRLIRLRRRSSIPTKPASI